MILVLIVIERSEPTGKAMTSQLVEFDDRVQLNHAEMALIRNHPSHNVFITVLKEKT